VIQNNSELLVLLGLFLRLFSQTSLFKAPASNAPLLTKAIVAS
jgi:hypothetical protein